MTKTDVSNDQIKRAVQQHYSKRIKEETGCCDSSCCSSNDDYARGLGYDQESLASLPSNAVESSFGCGNPLAFAGVALGDIVVDIGSGAGIDCFIAADKVGKEGRVFGIDMTPEMIARARENARQGGYEQVHFLLGEAEEMPLDKEVADWVISNCVINLSPDKETVFSEMYRVLKPGGQFSVSDIVLGVEIPQLLQSNLEAWSGCLSGALKEEDYLEGLRKAGFEAVEVSERLVYSDDQLRAMAGDLAISLEGESGAMLSKRFSGQVWSARIHGRKPA